MHRREHVCWRLTLPTILVFAMTAFALPPAGTRAEGNIFRSRIASLPSFRMVISPIIYPFRHPVSYGPVFPASSPGDPVFREGLRGKRCPLIFLYSHRAAIALAALPGVG